MPSRQRAGFTIGCLLILLIGFTLRMTRLDLSLNGDELVTANSILLDHLNPTKVEARMYIYLLLTAPLGWLVPNEWGIRWTSVMVGMMAIALNFRIASRIRNRWAGLIAALLIAIVPYYIHYSQVARYYSLVLCLALISIAVLLEGQARFRQWVHPLSLVLLTGLHMLAGVWVGIHLVVVALYRVITKRMLIAAVVGIIAILVLIQLVGMFGRYNFAQGLGWIRLRSPIVESIFYVGSAIGLLRDFGQTVLPFRFVNLTIAGVGVITGIGLWKHRKNHPDWPIVLLIVLAVVPPALLWIASNLMMPLFVVRYVIASGGALLLLIAIGISAVRPSWLAGITITVLCICAIFTDYAMFREPAQHDWRRAVEIIQTGWQEGDDVLTCTSESGPALRHYAPELSYHQLEATNAMHGGIWILAVTEDCDLEYIQERAEWLEAFTPQQIIKLKNLSIYYYDIE